MNRREFVSLAARFMAISPFLRFLPGAREEHLPAEKGYLTGYSAKIYVDGRRIDGGIGSMTMEVPAISTDLLKDAMAFGTFGNLTIVWEEIKYWSVEEDKT